MTVHKTEYIRHPCSRQWEVWCGVRGFGARPAASAVSVRHHGEARGTAASRRQDRRSSAARRSSPGRPTGKPVTSGSRATGTRAWWMVQPQRLGSAEVLHGGGVGCTAPTGFIEAPWPREPTPPGAPVRHGPARPRSGTPRTGVRTPPDAGTRSGPLEARYVTGVACGDVEGQRSRPAVAGQVTLDRAGPTPPVGVGPPVPGSERRPPQPSSGAPLPSRAVGPGSAPPTEACLWLVDRFSFYALGPVHRRRASGR